MMYSEVEMSFLLQNLISVFHILSLSKHLTITCPSCEINISLVMHSIFLVLSNLMLLVANLANIENDTKKGKMTETLANGHSFESAHQRSIQCVPT